MTRRTKKCSKVIQRSRYGFGRCSFGSWMLQPIEAPPASLAPRLAASMMAPRHHREPRPRKACPHLARQHVVAMCLGEPCRAEHGDTGSHEVQRPEAANELHEDPQGLPELVAPRLRALEEADARGRARILSPLRLGRRGPPAGAAPYRPLTVIT